MFFFYIAVFVLITGLVPLILFLVYRNKKSMTKSLIFLPFLILVFLASIYELVVTAILKVDSSVWFRIYPLLEFFTLTWVFNRLFQGKYRFWYLSFAGIFTFIWFVFFTDASSSFLQNEGVLNLLVLILVLSSCVIWFNKKIRFESENIIVDPLFYFWVGLLLYFCGTFFLFALGELLFNTSKKMFLQYWYINLFFIFILRLSLCTGIWKESRC